LYGALYGVGKWCGPSLAAVSAVSAVSLSSGLGSLVVRRGRGYYAEEVEEGLVARRGRQLSNTGNKIWNSPAFRSDCAPTSEGIEEGLKR
jgi:hypothetical protein